MMDFEIENIEETKKR